jgi:hypothetical protein
MAARQWASIEGRDKAGPQTCNSRGIVLLKLFPWLNISRKLVWCDACGNCCFSVQQHIGNSERSFLTGTERAPARLHVILYLQSWS